MYVFVGDEKMLVFWLLGEIGGGRVYIVLFFYDIRVMIFIFSNSDMIIMDRLNLYISLYFFSLLVISFVWIMYMK